MAKELERRFLINAVPEEVRQIVPTVVADCYWPVESGHCQLRMRRVGNRFEMTKKLPVSCNDLSIMEEHTIPLSEAEYSALKAAPAKWLVKDRYVMDTVSARVELGVFREKLEGLAIADVEFDTEAKMRMFSPLWWFGKEVTNEKRLAGGELCGSSIADLSQMLLAYGFQQLAQS